MEIIETGDLQRIYYERTEAVQVANVFTQIYGVGASLLHAQLISASYIPLGQQTALKWYQNGCRTLNDLLNGKGGVKLSENQKLGIKFYDGKCSESFNSSTIVAERSFPDLKLRMPREEAKAIFGLIKPIGIRHEPFPLR